MSQTPLAITSELQKLSPSAIIELFELDGTSVGAEVLRFHAGTNKLIQDIIWQGQTYYRYPVEASGFEINGQGQLPRPKLKVSNYMGSITAYLLLYQDLIGAKITRKRTLAKYLDATNFPDTINPSADATASFTDDVFYIDRKVSETRESIEFELVSSLDLMGVQLPKRQIIQNLCTWRYRSAECGYTDGAFFDKNDEPILTAPTAAGQLVIDSWTECKNARASYLESERALASASQVLNEASALVLESDQYQMPTSGYFGTTPPAYFVRMSSDGSKLIEAKWDGGAVSLGAVYRIGDYVERSGSHSGYSKEVFKYYRIQKWHTDAAAVASAQALYDAAKATRDSLKSAYNSALSTYQTNLAALPLNDPTFQYDRCGKRLTSCRVRFPEGDPPFGGFPGASLFK